MKYLVTGAAGFIGSSITDRLLIDGHEVIGVDCFVDYYPRHIKERNLTNARGNSRFSFIEANLNSVELTALLRDVQVVFHQAAQAGVRASWGKSFAGYTEHNVLATQKLLEACKEVGTVKKVVYASSSSVYGDAETYPTSEDVLPKPVSPYGVTKLAAEHLMVLYAKEFQVPTVSLRYFTVFGPRQRPDMAFNRFIRAALTKDELLLFGDGEQIRDFTFIDDIVEANIRAAERGEPGGVYNLGGGSQSTVNEVIGIIREHVGEIRVRREQRQKGDARRTCADTSRAKKALGFDPKVGLREGIQREIEWLSAALS